MRKKAIKRCRGISKAFGSGCGEIKEIHKYGLCFDCFKEWLRSTENGLNYIKSTVIKAKREVNKDKAKEKEEIKESLKTIAQLKTDVKKPFQKLIRIRDKGKSCICCDKILSFNIGDFDGGHLFKAELFSGVVFHPNNVNGQSVYCNQHLHGNEAEYLSRLPLRIGQEATDKLKDLAIKTKNYKWSRIELKELKEHYRRELREVERGSKSIDEVDFKKGIV